MPESIPRGPFDQGLFLTHFNKGEELFKAGQFEEAERQLEEAYLLRPRDVRVLNLLGLVYYRQEKFAKAEEVYRKLVTESPEAHTLHLNLGLICLKLDRLPEAEQAFLKALELSRGKNPKISFYLGSIYERTRRFKDAIYQYRQAGASLMVQRVEGKMGDPSPRAARRTTGPPAASRDGGQRPDTRPPATVVIPRQVVEPDIDTRSPATAAIPREVFEPHPDDESPEPTPEDEAALAPPRPVQPVSPALMSPAGAPVNLSETAKFRVFDDTLPPGRHKAPSPTQLSRAAPRSPDDTDPGIPAHGETFRCMERGLMEVDFAGKVFIKQGTIYSYSGNLTFWVKEKRAEGLPTLVIVTGTGRLLLTDQEREITLMRVDREAIFVEPSHLLACEEGLQPRYVRFGEGDNAVEVVVLEGHGLVALSVASKPLPLTVQPDLPVSVPAASVIMWTGQLVPAVVDDPQVYEVVRGGGGLLIRLQGTGRILAEQARA